MRIKFIAVTSGLLLMLTTVNAQKINWTEAGVWKEKSTSWNYNLDKGTGNAGDKFESGEQAKTSVASTATPGFLSYPPSGFATVSSAANAGGGFRIAEKGNEAKLTIDASRAGGANKFAVYDIAKTSAVSSLFFTLSFNENDPTNGAIVMGLGNSRGNNIFKNTTTLTGADASGIFTALRWEFSTNKSVFFSYRMLDGTSYSYKLINTSSFSKTGEHQVELYLNNSTTTQSYSRAGVAYNLDVSSFNIWVNGKIVPSTSGSAFPTSGEIAPEAPLNAFLFQGYHSKDPFPNALSITLGNIQLNSSK